MPADITGTDIIQESQQTGHRQLVFERGPIFSQIVLADEINRTPPKTQAALLEAMQEHEVTIGGTTYQLAEPFFVLAKSRRLGSLSQSVAATGRSADARGGSSTVATLAQRATAARNRPGSLHCRVDAVVTSQFNYLIKVR
jgi:hypothetical protein